MERKAKVCIARHSAGVWFSMLLMMMAVALRFVAFRKYLVGTIDALTMQLHIILPCVACVLFIVLVLVFGEKHLGITCIPIWMGCIYFMERTLFLEYSTFHVILCWIAAFLVSLIYTLTVSDNIKNYLMASFSVFLAFGIYALIGLVQWISGTLPDSQTQYIEISEMCIFLGVGLLLISTKHYIDGQDVYRRRWCDRADGRYLRTLSPMHKLEPYIMDVRNDACNYFSDTIEISAIEDYIREKRKAGFKGFSIMHVFIATFVRVVADRPALNRFIAGQKIYSRGENIQVNLDIKTEMTLEAPDTVIKAELTPWDTAEQVYASMKELVDKNKGSSVSDFDNTAKLLNYIPGLVKKYVIKFVRLIDYFGLMPKFLGYVSPFHGSMFITSIGSLGLPPIYHHLYNFGNVPIFIAFGAKRTEYEQDSKGNMVKHKYVDYKMVVDERICDGYYYASAFKLFRSYLRHPDRLDVPPAEIVQDVE